MTRDNPVNTRAGVELVRKLASEGDCIFTSACARELAPAVGLSQSYLNQALHHLARSGWVIRFRKGLYAISSTVPGVMPAHEFEVAMALVDPASISHWSALHHHGLTEQVPRQVFVLTTSEASVPGRRGAENRQGHRSFAVAGTPYQFVQVKPDRFFGLSKVWIGDARVTITDPERTLLAGLSMPQYCGDFAGILHALKTLGTDLALPSIIEYALMLDAARAKRLGWVLEHQGVDPAKLERLAALPIKGYRKLDPTGPRKGPCNRSQVRVLPGERRRTLRELAFQADP